jgi:uncharacterized membrane protein YfcA
MAWYACSAMVFAVAGYLIAPHLAASMAWLLRVLLFLAYIFMIWRMEMKSNTKAQAN